MSDLASPHDPDASDIELGATPDGRRDVDVVDDDETPKPPTITDIVLPSNPVTMAAVMNFTAKLYADAVRAETDRMFATGNLVSRWLRSQSGGVPLPTRDRSLDVELGQFGESGVVDSGLTRDDWHAYFEDRFVERRGHERFHWTCSD